MNDKATIRLTKCDCWSLGRFGLPVESCDDVEGCFAIGLLEREGENDLSRRDGN